MPTRKGVSWQTYEGRGVCVLFLLGDQGIGRWKDEERGMRESTIVTVGGYFDGRYGDVEG